MTILFAILLFSVLIFVHELGHFVTAKLFGVRVNEFSMFMGPAIWKKQKGETLYSIRCIPIGGYCAMEGEDEETDDPRSFQKAAWWKRIIILAAGSFMNLVAGFILVTVVNCFLHQAIPQVDYLRTGSTLAMDGGLRVGDTVLEIDGKKVNSTTDFSLILQEDPDDTQFEVLVIRDGQEVLLENVTMIPQEFPENEEGSAGVFYGVQWATIPLTFPQVLEQSCTDCVEFVKMVGLSIKMLLSGDAKLSDMSGPVGIVAFMNETAQASDTKLNAVLNLLYLGAFIAVNLAVMNMLPIPALDGGRIVCLLLTALIEAITRKKIDPKYEGYIHAVGMIALLGLMAIIMFKDIWTLF